MRVAVVTRDSRVYYTATKVLKRYGMGFYSLCPGERIPFDVDVVLTSREESGRIDFPSKVVVEDENFIDRLLMVMDGKKGFEHVYIAIDPGERPGLCVVADSRVLEVHHLRSPRDVEVIIELLRKYPGARIKVGHGAPRQRVLMLRALADFVGYDYPLLLVNESQTTPRVGGADVSQVQDIVAAINIGLREGREVRLGELIGVRNPTQGEIDEIKRRSRELSGNVTISSKLAREVAVGNMTIEEAIRRQRRGLK